jgi:hypothetical protein
VQAAGQGIRATRGAYVWTTTLKDASGMLITLLHGRVLPEPTRLKTARVYNNFNTCHPASIHVQYLRSVAVVSSSKNAAKQVVVILPNQLNDILPIIHRTVVWQYYIAPRAIDQPYVAGEYKLAVCSLKTYP